MLLKIFHAEPSLVSTALISFSGDVLNGFMMNYLYMENIKYGQKWKFIGSETALRMKGALRGLTYVAGGAILYDMLSNGINYNNVSDAVGLALSSYLAYAVETHGIAGLAHTIGTVPSAALGIGFLLGSAYAGAYSLTEITNSINMHYGNMNFWVDVYNWGL